MSKLPSVSEVFSMVEQVQKGALTFRVEEDDIDLMLEIYSNAVEYAGRIGVDRSSVVAGLYNGGDRLDSCKLKFSRPRWITIVEIKNFAASVRRETVTAEQKPWSVTMPAPKGWKPEPVRVMIGGKFKAELVDGMIVI